MQLISSTRVTSVGLVIGTDLKSHPPVLPVLEDLDQSSLHSLHSPSIVSEHPCPGPLYSNHLDVLASYASKIVLIRFDTS